MITIFALIWILPALFCGRLYLRMIIDNTLYRKNHPYLHHYGRQRRKESKGYTKADLRFSTGDTLSWLLVSLVGGAFTWPVFLPYAAIRSALSDDGGGLLRALAGESRSEKQAAKIKRMEIEAKERDEHIANLERETEIVLS